jgi:predicted transcriptional regulator
MEKMKVRELMRPVQEFPRISDQATFMDAVEALEKAQQAFSTGKAAQRILLVYDEAGKIVGKLSPMDLVQGLEPNYDRIDSLKSESRYRLGQNILDRMKEEFRLWQRPLMELCKKAYNVRIENFVKLPSPDHMVKVDDKMDGAFHLFVVGRHDSLFVKEEEEIVGLIRFSDVYKKIAQTMRECPMPGLGPQELKKELRES